MRRLGEAARRQETPELAEVEREVLLDQFDKELARYDGVTVISRLSVGNKPRRREYSIVDPYLLLPRCLRLLRSPWTQEVGVPEDEG